MTRRMLRCPHHHLTKNEGGFNRREKGFFIRADRPYSNNDEPRT
jgi:hypothetical protein